MARSRISLISAAIMTCSAYPHPVLAAAWGGFYPRSNDRGSTLVQFN